ncbi:hypothetical protein NDU88_005547 [Pleurodeles waltl]|uniref:Uncharacterized protein n=1 Tax=Pleurodeles waltl TaxID=8319 RepID=A0AAV7WYV3_PLEWA|nr:hypothetical protein NDU88_005547 [Pleurodeles waltl]
MVESWCITGATAVVAAMAIPGTVVRRKYRPMNRSSQVQQRGPSRARALTDRRDISDAEPKLRSLESDRLGNPDLEPRLQEAQEKVAELTERLCPFDYRACTARAHTEGDRAGRLLAWLAYPARRSSLIVKLNLNLGTPLETQEEINAYFAAFYRSLYRSRPSVDTTQ